MADAADAGCTDFHTEDITECFSSNLGHTPFIGSKDLNVLTQCDWIDGEQRAVDQTRRSGHASGSGIVDSLGNPITTLTFDAATWNTPQVVTVRATDDATTENFMTEVVTHTIQSGPALYLLNTTGPTINVDIFDNETAGAFVEESDGETLVSKNGDVTDSYTIRLTKAPAIPDGLTTAESELLNRQLETLGADHELTLAARRDARFIIPFPPQSGTE